jgi:hypothetical protein
MTEAIRINGLKSDKIRGVSASVMYSVPVESRVQLSNLIADGLTTEDALEVIAGSISLRTDRVTRVSRVQNENPFSSS